MPIIDRFFDRGREFLGSCYPIICGAMTCISDPRLVKAIKPLNTVIEEGRVAAPCTHSSPPVDISFLRDKVEHEQSQASRLTVNNAKLQKEQVM